MKKNRETGFVLLATIAALILAGCPQEVVEDPSGDAGLSSITINEISVEAPEGIDRDAWLADDFQVSSMNVAEAIFPSDAFDGDGEMKNASVGVSTAGSGAEIYFLKVSSILKPEADDPGWTTDSSFTFKDKDSLYIQVTSADKRSQSYYRVQIIRLSSETGLLALVIGSRGVPLADAPGATTIADVTPVDSNQLVFGVENFNVPVEALKKDPLAQAQYGLVKASETGEPQWSDTATYTLDEGDKVYIKVTSSDAAASRYYGVRIHTFLRVSSVNIGGISELIPEHGAASAAGAVGVEIVRTLETVSGVLSTISSDFSTVEYDLVSANGTPSFKPITLTTTVSYTHGGVLYLRASGDGVPAEYFRFNIVLKTNNRAISGITIGGTAVTTVGTGATGVSVGTGTGLRGAASISGTVAAGPVAVTFESDKARVTGFAVLASNVNPTAASYTAVDPPATTFNLASAITTGQHLHIRVEAENGTVWYHRIVVTVTL